MSRGLPSPYPLRGRFAGRWVGDEVLPQPVPYGDLRRARAHARILAFAY